MNDICDVEGCEREAEPFLQARNPETGEVVFLCTEHLLAVRDGARAVRIHPIKSGHVPRLVVTNFGRPVVRLL